MLSLICIACKSKQVPNMGNPRVQTCSDYSQLGLSFLGTYLKREGLLGPFVCLFVCSFVGFRICVYIQYYFLLLYYYNSLRVGPCRASAFTGPYWAVSSVGPY